MMQVNLIPMHRRVARRRRTAIHRWSFACACYAFALGVVWVGLASTLNADRAAIESDLADADLELKTTKQELAEHRRDLRRVQAHLDANREVTGLPDWSLLLGLLAKQVGDDVVLSECNLLPVEQTVQVASPSPQKNAPAAGATISLSVAGLARSQPAVSQFVLRLEELGLFTKVKLVDTRREPFLDGNAIAFQIDCALDLEAR